ncbi:MAG: GNAT family N-acetyltransferase [Acidimicrobiales bacterium]
MAKYLHVDERSLSSREIRDAAHLTSRAFFDDAYFRFLFPSDEARARVLPMIFRTQLRHLGPHGRVATVRDERGVIVGVAAWMPPNTFPPSLRTQLAQLPGSLRAFYRQMRSLRVVGTYLRALLKIHPKEPHWYLMLLAVDPPLQRRGAGTMLVEHGLSVADREGVGAYLETQKEDNLAFYRLFGFALRETIEPMAGGPSYYTMWREAR